MSINYCLFVILIIKCSCDKTVIKTYPIVDLLENSPVNTFVFQFPILTNITRSLKLNLLNLNGFERNKFQINNQILSTKTEIDREEFLRRNYCDDHNYCKIEIHILVDDGLEYWVLPIHIVDENDNKPEFSKYEIELKLLEKTSNGYKIRFDGAKDIDEGLNGKINYKIDCLYQILINCSNLFELDVLSQSSFNYYDKLILKYNKLTNENSLNQYILKISAIDNKNKTSSMILKLKIEENEKEKESEIKFSSDHYKFVYILNSTSNRYENGIGRVYAISNDPSKRIYYKILFLTNENKKKIDINSLTGQINIVNENLIKYNDEIEFIVEASIKLRNKIVKCQTNVKIIFRYFYFLNNISFSYDFMSLNYFYYIYQLNNSNTFLVNQFVEPNQILFQISLHSFYYPSDQYVVSLNNYLKTFSISKSSSSTNSFYLKTQQYLKTKSIYLLNISIKHHLSQQWLSNLVLELIVIDQWTTTTTTTTTTTRIPTITTTLMMVMTSIPILSTIFDDIYPIETSSIDHELSENEFCIENKSYVIKKDENQIGLLKVKKPNFHPNKINANYKNVISLDENEFIYNNCQMLIERLNRTLNKSTQYQLCSLNDQCLNLTFIILKNDSLQTKSHRFLSYSNLSIKLILFSISVLFVILTIILICVLFRLKNIEICFYIHNCISINRQQSAQTKKQFNQNIQHLTSRENIEQFHTNIMPYSYSSSFESSLKRENLNEPYIFNIDHLLDEEPLPSTNMFTLPPNIQLSSSSSLSFSSSTDVNRSVDQNNLKHRTSSSSSFLQETKQLLDMISSNQQSDLSKSNANI